VYVPPPPLPDREWGPETLAAVEKRPPGVHLVETQHAEGTVYSVGLMAQGWFVVCETVVKRRRSRGFVRGQEESRGFLAKAKTFRVQWIDCPQKRKTRIPRALLAPRSSEVGGYSD